jgi:hypothetical protein
MLRLLRLSSDSSSYPPVAFRLREANAAAAAAVPDPLPRRDCGNDAPPTMLARAAALNPSPVRGASHVSCLATRTQHRSDASHNRA